MHGVTWDTEKKHWRVGLCVAGKLVHGKTFRPSRQDLGVEVAVAMAKAKAEMEAQELAAKHGIIRKTRQVR